jgi:hypothetical protein
VGGNLTRFAGQRGKPGHENGHRLEKALFTLSNFGFDLLFRDSGDILLSESVSHRIRLIKGDMVSDFAGSKEGHLDGPLDRALFNLPCSLVEINRHIYVADAENHSVRVITPDGQVGTLVKSSDRHSPAGPAFPFYLSASPDLATLYIAELYVGRVSAIDLQKKELKQIGTVDSPRSLHALPDGSILAASYKLGFVHMIRDKQNETLPPMEEEKAAHQYASCLNPQSGDLAWSPDAQQIIYIYRNMTFPSRLSLQGVDLTSLLDLPPSAPLFATSSNSPAHPIAQISLPSRTVGIPASLLGWMDTETKSVSHPKSASSSINSAPISTESAVLKRIEQAEAALRPRDENVALAFVESLLGSSNFVRTENPMLSANITLQVAQLYHEIEFDTKVFETLLHRVCFQLSPVELVSLLSIAWHQKCRSSSLLNIIANQLRYHSPSTWSLEHHFSADTKDPDFQRLTRQISDPDHQFFDPSTLLPPTKLCLPLFPYLCDLASELNWSKTLPAVRYPESFHLSISGYKGFLAVNRFVLHARWSYFRRMFAAGLEECLNGLCELPSSFPHSLLLAIARFLYTNQTEDQEISQSDASFYLEQGGEFELIPLDDEFNHPFWKLHLACKALVSSSAPPKKGKKSKSKKSKD